MRYAINEYTTILPFRQSETIVDPPTKLAREGARRMLAEALKAQADAFVASFADEHWRMVASGLCGTDLVLNGRSSGRLVL